MIALSYLRASWQVEDREAAWTVEVRGRKGWILQAAPVFHRLYAPPLPAHRIYRATLRNLAPGATVPYRVTQDSAVVFEAEHVFGGPEELTRRVGGSGRGATPVRVRFCGVDARS